MSDVEVRSETATDVVAVREVTTRAFTAAEHSAPPVAGESVPGEVTLVEWLRASSAYDERFAVVACADGEIVGHAMATWGEVAGVPVLGVGPVSVDPAVQGRGVGSALMEELLERARDAGEDVVVLLGDPSYYRRFGFVPASTVGLVADPEWGEYFQACVLQGGGATEGYVGPRGRYTYAEPFSRLG